MNSNAFAPLARTIGTTLLAAAVLATGSPAQASTTPAPTPSAPAQPAATATQSPTPTSTATAEPTTEPTAEPTAEPTTEPTLAPTPTSPTATADAPSPTSATTATATPTAAPKDSKPKESRLSTGAKEVQPSGTDSAQAMALTPLSCGTVTSQDSIDATTFNSSTTYRLTQKMAGAMTAYRVSCARAVVAEVKRRGFPQRAAEIAASVIIVETAIQNLDGGDLDSVGLYQQRDSWGTFQQRTNPAIATDLFLNEMQRLYPNGSWLTADPGLVAANVQRPADQYRDRYAQNMQDAVKIATLMWSHVGVEMTMATLSGTGDFTGDRIPDLIGINRNTNSGQLTLYRGDGKGGVASSTTFGAGWNTFTALLRADFSGDGKQDILARDSKGLLKIYRGNGTGGLTSPVTVANTAGWNQFVQLVSPGDWSGDGRPDLLAINPAGDLYMYAIKPVNGLPQVTTGVKVAGGWNRFKKIVAVGDATKDGRPDVVGIDIATGNVLLYASNGTSSGSQTYKGGVGYGGWDSFVTVAGLGDFTGDGYPDLAGIDSSSPYGIRVYPGANGSTSTLGTVNNYVFGSGWNQFVGLF